MKWNDSRPPGKRREIRTQIDGDRRTQSYKKVSSYGRMKSSEVENSFLHILRAENINLKSVSKHRSFVSPEQEPFLVTRYFGSSSKSSRY